MMRYFITKIIITLITKNIHIFIMTYTGNKYVIMKIPIKTCILFLFLLTLDIQVVK